MIRFDLFFLRGLESLMLEYLPLVISFACGIALAQGFHWAARRRKHQEVVRRLDLWRRQQ